MNKNRELEIWNSVLKEDMKNIKTSKWSENAIKAMHIYAIEILQDFKKRIRHSSLSIDAEIDIEIIEIKNKEVL